MPQQDLLAVVLGGVVIDDFGDNCTDGVPTANIESLNCSTHITLSQGMAFYGVLLLAASAASLVSFSRRDVV